MSNKKITEKDMYPYAWKALRSRFPLSEGWAIHEQDTRGKSTYIPDFTVEKITRYGIYRIPVEVKLECTVKKAHIDQLNRYAKSLAGPNIKIQNKILVYPAGTNTDLKPNDMGIIFLRNFSCT